MLRWSISKADIVLNLVIFSFSYWRVPYGGDANTDGFYSTPTTNKKVQKWEKREELRDGWKWLVLVPVEPASAYWQQEYCTLAARILLAGSKTFARWQQDKFLTGINADHTSRTECKWSRNPKWGFVILKCMDVSTFPSWDVLVLHANVYNLDILDFI